MSSILTNNGAMVALQTLNSINKNMATTQNEISTGMSIASAKDNSAIWAISTVMRSDVAGFEAISESLALGSSTVAVARNAAEQVTELLNQVKGKVVSAQEENVDREKIQTDISALRDQIVSITGAAQFNGLNLLSGTANVSVLSSLDRSTDGTVSQSSITVARQDLTTATGAFGATSVGSAGDLITGDGNVGSALAGNAAANAVVTITDGGVTDGASYRMTLQGAASADIGTTAQTFEYVAVEGDTAADVVTNLAGQISTFLTEQGSSEVTVASDTSAGTVTVSLAGGAAAGDTVTVGIAEALDGTRDGGLLALGAMDVTSDAGAAQALTDIEALIQTAVDAAAQFGSVQGRIEIQSDFIGQLSDSLKSGIGALVDANMEEASARLQALQVQQQLGIQSLSIANQAPQNILSLFR
ncbi:flagellin [Rhodobacteraceae bacterium 2CG4]|uniref:Flagellin n=1 Tax=Halovulum marinum TaxID=2662447 RepID=A0A6L5Z6Q9_9RHOB|nr:flagellin [Halovulum marinum]MSU91790.1 flagellin [Halovulum marinum]